MNILQIVYEFPGSTSLAIVSGEIKNPYYLSKNLKDLGHNVIIGSCPVITKLPYNQSKSEFKVYNFNEGYLKGFLKYTSRGLNSYKKIKKIIKEENIDIIHAHSPSLTLGLAIARKFKKNNIPLVITAHGTYIPELYADVVGLSFKDRILKINGWIQFYIDKISFKSADRLISVSKFQTEEMDRIYKLPKSKIDIITNGVELSVFKSNPKDIELINRLDLKDKRIILFVGRLVRKKGIQYLAEAAKIVKEKVSEIKFIIIGGTKEFALHKSELEEAVKSYGMQDDFIWLSNIPESLLTSYYNIADVCVVPSINYESIPTVIFEAMASGTPILATNAWGVPEVLKVKECLIEEKNAKDISNKIVDLLIDGDKCEEISIRNIEEIKRWSWSIKAKEHEKIYEEVIKNAKLN